MIVSERLKQHAKLSNRLNWAKKASGQGQSRHDGRGVAMGRGVDCTRAEKRACRVMMLSEVTANRSCFCGDVGVNISE